MPLIAPTFDGDHELAHALLVGGVAQIYWADGQKGGLVYIVRSAYAPRMKWNEDRYETFTVAWEKLTELVFKDLDAPKPKEVA